MTYNQFIDAVEKQVREAVKDEAAVTVYNTVKNNGNKRWGLTIAPRDVNIFPTIYLEEYYQHYQQGYTLEEVTTEVLRLYEKVRFRHCWSGEFIQDYEQIKDKIVYRLVNHEENQELLKEIPHETCLDLAIIFYVMVDVTAYGSASMMIRKEHLDIWGVKEQDIFYRARQNTKKLLPSEFASMSSVIEELTGHEEVDDQAMYVLSNRIRSYGATAVLYEGCLKGIGEYLKENYYIIPSSVHEVIILGKSMVPSRSMLNDLVQYINETQVSQEERLSDHIYYYDRVEGKLSF